MNENMTFVTAGRPLFDYLPVGFFGSVMGLTGLSVAWRLAAVRYGVPEWIAGSIGTVAVIVFLALCIGYGHNLGDFQIQLALARELKAQGKVRYTGVTHYLESAQDRLADVVQAERPDFLQINYSVVTRGAEKRLLPMAADLGVAVLINRAFEDGKLFVQVKNKPLPPWSDEAGITSWAQAFLRFALSHPAVTCVIPATGKPDRQSDNLKAGTGASLTQEQRASLIAAVG